jgi:hypothetical protein
MAGVRDHPNEVMLLVALGPVAFFAYVCGALLVVEELPSYGWVLLALSGLPLGLLLASVGAREPSAEIRSEAATQTV